MTAAPNDTVADQAGPVLQVRGNASAEEIAVLTAIRWRQDIPAHGIDKDARGFSKGLGVCFEGIEAHAGDRDALRGFLSKADDEG